MKHFLHLKEHWGSLKRRCWDLPERAEDPRLFFLRQQEKQIFPLSYRSGLVFFVTVLCLSLFAITSLDATTLAEQKRQELAAEITRTLSMVHQQMEAPAEVHVPDPNELLERAISLPSHQALHQVNMNISTGYQAFSSLLKIWDQENDDIIALLKRSQDLIPRILSSWDEEMLLEAELDVLKTISSRLKRASQISPLLTKALGDDEPQRIAIFLYDAGNIKGSTGMLSTAMEILIDEGRILSSKTIDTGDLGIHVILDGARTMEEIKKVWEEKMRNSLDMVILLHPQLLQLILKYSENWGTKELPILWSATRLSGDPEALKKLTHSLLTAAANELKNPRWWLLETEVLIQSIAAKQLLVSSANENISKQLESWGLSGRLPSPTAPQDTLMISHVNHTDDATDHWMVEEQTLHTALNEEKSIRHWLQIKREHRGNQLKRSEVSEMIGESMSEGVYRQLNLKPNISTARVLIPSGSTLISSAGVDIEKISIVDRGAFLELSYEQEISAGDRQTIELVYDLAWSFQTEDIDTHRLQLIKAGARMPASFQHAYKTPLGVSVFQELPEQKVFLHEQDQWITIVAGKKQP